MGFTWESFSPLTPDLLAKESPQPIEVDKSSLVDVGFPNSVPIYCIVAHVLPFLVVVIVILREEDVFTKPFLHTKALSCCVILKTTIDICIIVIQMLQIG